MRFSLINKRWTFALLFLLIGSIIILSALIAISTISKSRYKTEMRAQFVDVSNVRAIYTALRLFQETKAYQQMLDESTEDWIIFSENSGRSLYDLLSDPENAPYGGYLMHIRDEAIDNKTFLNPWGTPYRAAIFIGRGGSENQLHEIGLCPGKNGSVIFVLSNDQSDDHMFCQSEKSIPNL